MTKIVRVAVTNNFNLTDQEFNQLNQIKTNFPNNKYFINSNILSLNNKTADRILRNDYKIVLTVNPNLLFTGKEPLHLLNKIKEKIGFIRVKYIFNKEIDEFIELNSRNFPIVLTLFRFNAEETLSKYTDKLYYNFCRSRWRLKNKYINIIKEKFNKPNIYICDLKQKGCSSCGLCNKLTYNIDSAEIYSLNLSSSGVCKFNCIDCYAKTMQHFLSSINKSKIKYDVIKKNKKQQ